jgi:hypothetical protein
MKTWLLISIVVVAVVAVAMITAVRRTGDECTVLQTIRLDESTRVEIVDDACKEGLPHTTDASTIRMTRATWEGARREEVLRHERVHCAQKGSDARAWRDFYARAWEYTIHTAPPATLPATLVARLRPNPDTADAPWALWRGRWLFFPVFGADRKLATAQVIVWDTETRRALDAPPEQWRAAFCGRDGACPHQYEHPHEIAAEYLTDLKSTASAATALFSWRAPTKFV